MPSRNPKHCCCARYLDRCSRLATDRHDGSRPMCSSSPVEDFAVSEAFRQASRHAEGPAESHRGMRRILTFASQRSKGNRIARECHSVARLWTANTNCLPIPVPDKKWLQLRGRDTRARSRRDHVAVLSHGN